MPHRPHVARVPCRFGRRWRIPRPLSLGGVFAVPAEIERVPVAFAVTLLIYGIIGLALLWRFTLEALAE